MRLLTVFPILLLTLTACAVPDRGASSPAAPTSVPAKSIAAPADAATTEAFDPAIRATLETSLLATEWKGSPEGSVLFPLDPASGTARPGYTPISLGQVFSHAFSSDKRILAAVSFPNENAYDGSLLLIDLSTWKTRRFELDLDGWVSTMVFSPDGKQLAVAHGESSYQLTMINIARGVILAQSQIDAYVTRMKFTESGDALMLYTPAINVMNGLSADPPQVRLLDAANLSTRWSAELKDVRDGVFPTNENVTSADLYEPGNAVYLSPGVAFAPDGNVLYIIHADSEQLTTVDFDTQKFKTTEIKDKLSWFERLLSITAGVVHAKIADGTSKQAVVSPDGQFLYVVGFNSASNQDKQGNWQMEQTPLGLEIIQTSDGSRVDHIETDTTELSLSPDGRFLYLRNWVDTAPWTEIFDTSSREIIAREEALYATPARLLNGEFLLVSTYVSSEEKYHMSVLQPSDLSVVADWTGPEFIYWLTAP